MDSVQTIDKIALPWYTLALASRSDRQDSAMVDEGHCHARPLLALSPGTFQVPSGCAWELRSFNRAAADTVSDKSGQIDVQREIPFSQRVDRDVRLYKHLVKAPPKPWSIIPHS